MTTYEHRPTKIGETPLLTDATGTQMVVMKDGRVSRLPFASYQTNMQGYLDDAVEARDVAIEKRDDAVEAADAAVPAAATAVAQAAIATTKAAEALASQGVATTGAGTATTKAAEAVAKALEATQARDAVMAAAVAAGSGPATTLLYPALNKILASATDIVDVMVYDTRQDSDGGAWRFKCEHTSWYQEALNTATRGARREFPAVAALVLRNVLGALPALTIYDLTDLDGSGNPRMWAVFQATGTGAMRQAGTLGSTNNLTSVFALNGRIWVGAGVSGGSGVGGLNEIELPGDTAHYVVANGALPAAQFPVGLAQRNTFAGTWTNSANSTRIRAGIVDRNVNHVTARVLPSAPLDAAGLPIPTVLCSTAAGASVIHPNGAVYDITVASGYARGLIAADGRLTLVRAQNNGEVVEYGAVPYADVVNTTWRSHFSNGNASASSAAFRAAGFTFSAAPGALGGSAGVTFVAEDFGNAANSMVSTAAISYATGWQPGGEAIRLATLCDATTGNITGSAELVTNGDFTTDLSGWTVTVAGSSTVTQGSGAASMTTDGTNAAEFDQAITTVVGRAYLIAIPITAHSGGALTLRAGNSRGSSALGSVAATATGTMLLQFTATATTTWFGLFKTLTAGTSTIDNVSCRLAVPDRSSKGKGLIPVGTLSRTAVAAGADMVAFSGFGAANYLEQPANADLDFGTADFCLQGWVRNTSATTDEEILERRGASGAWYRVAVNNTSGAIRLQLNDGTNLVSFQGTSSLATSTWTHFACVRRGSVAEIWVNGVRESTASVSGLSTLTNTSAILRVGVNYALTSDGSANSLCMFRTAAYAPTPAQIARMYRDELPLFQPGVKCLLGGTSNAVADMDFDATRNELIVGTADGVSEFSGLVRTSYIDTVSSGVLTNDNMRAVASQAGHRLLAGGAEVVAQRDAINGIDVMTRARPPAPERFIARGRTTDATPTNLSPRVFVGERELVRFKMRVIGKMVGAAASERFGTVIDCQAYRDAGGNVTLDIAAASQKLARWNGSAAVENTSETTSTMEAAFVVDTASQTVAIQVTGKAATVIVWRAEIVGAITRESEETSYAA